MSVDPKHVQALFLAAVEVGDQTLRQELLDRECLADIELRQRVEALLLAHDDPKLLLDQPSQVVSPATLVPPSPQPVVSSVIAGRYKLLESIGEGGMGTVWVAEQAQPMRRKVAIKLIKPGMDSRQVLARFEGERQALAMMDHPNIAKVFDGGVTDQGRPYFVMEYVKGVSITKYCDDAKLSLSERLALFIPVCQAVQHAHQKGIIHRDLKPSNILICLYDGRPVPKVIDFGLAKAIFQPLTDLTLHTGHGIMLGTPLYMSPEQAEHNNLDVDTRTDIYSLGVILYELLTGSTPLEKQHFANAAFQEILRLIKEVEPPKPSTRLTESLALPSIASHRSLEPLQLSRMIKGDLDWIVMKALEKERGRRYETASSLARDVERFLNDEVVEASPPSKRYRLQKFISRHRKVLLTVAAFATLLCVGLLISTWQAIRATTAEHIAQENENKALQSANAERAAREREAAQRLVAENSERAAVTARQAAEKESARADAKELESRRSLYIAHMNLAQTAWKDSRAGRTIQLLDEHGPGTDSAAFRNFEWHYWDRLCHRDLLTIHGDVDFKIGCFAYSPDGKWLAIAEENGDSIALWDAMTGEQRLTLDGHTSPSDSVAFSPDGTRLASASYDQTVRVWDVNSGASLLTLKGHDDAISCAAFSPDGTRILSAARDGQLKVWNAATGHEVLTLNALERRNRKSWKFAFSPDGRSIAAESADHTISIWNASTGEETATFKGHTGDVEAVSFSPDSKLLATASTDQTIKLWDLATRQLAATLTGHKGEVWDAVFSPDGRQITSVSEDRTVKVWEVSTGRELLTLKGHTEPVWCVVYSPDGKQIASAGDDRTVKIWDAATGRETVTFHGHADDIEDIAFSYDGRKVASLSLDAVKIWDPTLVPVTLTLTGHTDVVEVVAFSPSGDLIGSASRDGTVKLWNATNGQQSLELQGHGGLVESLAFSPVSATLASGHRDHSIRIWDFKTGLQTRQLHVSGERISSIAFSLDDGHIASATVNGPSQIWDIASGHTALTLPVEMEYVNSIAYSPNGKTLATGCINDSITLWDAATGKELMVLNGHTDGVNSANFSPNGTRLASASDDATVKLWDTATGKELMTLRGHSEPVNAVVFSRDGTRIASASDDQTIKLWDVSTGRETLTYKATRAR